MRSWLLLLLYTQCAHTSSLHVGKEDDKRLSLLDHIMVNILITGSTGYIGGTLLNRLTMDGKETGSNHQVFTSVRKSSDVAKVSAAFPSVKVLLLDVADADAIRKSVVENRITVVVETVDAFSFSTSKAFIRALAQIKSDSGVDVHFFHTSGAKLFSSHTGADFTKVLSDTSNIYDVQSRQSSPHTAFKKVLPVNNAILKLGDDLDVRTYIVVPPMVYGPGEGPGNKTSIQILALFRIARALGTLYEVDETDTTWAMCHVLDLVSLYLVLLDAILAKQNPPSGVKGGFYFAENGTFSWWELSRALLSSLGKSEALSKPGPTQLEEMGKVLGCPAAWVPVSIAGACSIRGDNGRQLGWKPQYDHSHLMSSVKAETAFMLQEDGASKKENL